MQRLTLGAYLKSPGGPYLGKANIKIFAILVMCRLLDRHVALFPLLNSSLCLLYLTIVSFNGRRVYKQS